jgi:hypothetical protein
MACNCNQTPNCAEVSTCLCGVVMDIYDSGVFVESVVFNTYTDGVNTFFETTEDTVFNPPVTSPITISYNSDSWQMSYGSGDGTVVFGTFTTPSVCPITDCDWLLDPEVVSSTFTIKVYSVDCGCCDESLNVSLTYLGDDYTAVANIAKDENGNALGYNGYSYYPFTIYVGDIPTTYYLWFNLDAWYVSKVLGDTETFSTKLDSNSECPFGPYSIEAEFTRFSVAGAECFNCCNYYTPRFSNFIKKKKYQLVDGISAIRSKELFGFKCGPEWTDLAKQHLILNVLHCLPYGVLCEETEQCLMNNLNENCNC